MALKEHSGCLGTREDGAAVGLHSYAEQQTPCDTSGASLNRLYRTGVIPPRGVQDSGLEE